MYKKINFLIVLAFMFSVVGCKKYLDKPVTSDIDISEVFDQINQVKPYVNNMYTTLENGYSRFNNGMYASVTDEAYYSLTPISTEAFNHDGWNAIYNPDDRWNTMYAQMRKAAIFFENRSKVQVERGGTALKDLDDPNNALISDVLKRLSGEVFFLRAYTSFELLKKYGSFVIVEKSFSLNDNFTLPRNTPEECVAFIARDLDSAVSYLPVKYTGINEVNVGRASKAIAMAYKARLMLYAASANYTTSQSAAKWQTAANAAKAVMDLNIYSLESNYATPFSNQNSNEIVFSQRNSGGSNTLESYHTPVGYDLGLGGINPSQQLVNDFEMANGKKITDATSGYDPANPYIGRDPRFYKTINYNGASWRGRPIETFTGGKDGPGVLGATQTGYYMRKFLDPNIDLKQGDRSIRSWVYMRYAEVLLNYAEAQNEAVGADATVYKAVEDIRKRAGLSPFILAAGLSKTEMRTIIHHERRIELCFEDARFWDVRRWKVGEQLFGTPLMGVTITKTGNTVTYAPKQADARVFTPKMYLYPIPQGEILSNKQITQNLGW